MAISTSVEFVGADALLRAMQRNKFAETVFTNFIRDLATDLERNATVKAPTGVSGGGGGLRGSITRDRRQISKFVVSVGSNLGYAKAIEFGSRPHWPPPGSLARWARLKLGVPAARVQSVDYLIRRKISKKGTKAQPFLNPALDQTRRNYFPRRSQRMLKDWGAKFVNEVTRGGGFR